MSRSDRTDRTRVTLDRRRASRTDEAVALGYDRGADEAPRVLARGSGTIAESILAHAAEHGIPVHEDPDLLQCLAPLRVGAEIPVEAYLAVAQILAFLYERNADHPDPGDRPLP